MDDPEFEPEEDAAPPLESLDEIAERFELPSDFSAQAAEMARLEELEIHVPDAPPVVHTEVADSWIVEPAEASGLRPSQGNRAAPRLGLVWRLAGHALFALLGLVAGYYILCWIEPRGNFLNLRLPGIETRPVRDLR